MNFSVTLGRWPNMAALLLRIPEIKDSNFVPKPSTLTDDFVLNTSRQMPTCIAANTHTFGNPENRACDCVIFLSTNGLKSELLKLIH